MLLKAKSEQSTQLTIGDGNQTASSNVLEFDIDFGDSAGERTVWLHLTVPLGNDGLLASAMDAAKVKVECRRSADQGSLTLQGNPATTTKKWSSDDEGIKIRAGDRIEVRISNVLCKTSAGKSQITVLAEVDEADGTEASLTITKVKPTGASDPILYFSADPPYLIGRGKVTLRWDLLDGQSAQLMSLRGRKRDVGPGDSEELVINETTTWTLDCNNKNQRQITVQVLAGGWHTLEPKVFPHASSDGTANAVFPSVVFGPPLPKDKDEADALYAIFLRNAGAGNPEVVFCKSPDGVSGWEPIDRAVPDEMVSSPGVRIAGRLWLVCGSACDPKCPSDRIAFYDIDAKDNRWRYADVDADEGWGPRSGHACVVMGDEIVVFGGLDEFGLATSEMWVLSPEVSDKAVKVRAKKKTSPGTGPSPRCFHGAAVFDNKIWIVGGMESPNGKPCGDYWWRVGNAGEWRKRKESPTSICANSIGVGLAVCNPHLHAVVRSRSDGKTSTDAFMIGEKQITEIGDTWSQSGSTPELPLDWSSDPHSITVAGFQNRLYLRCLHRNALHQGGTASLQVYVPLRP